MEDWKQNQEFMLDLTLTRNLIDSVATPGQDALDLCSISLLRFSTGNAILITWRIQARIHLNFYLQLIKLAKAVQTQHGSTQIYLRHCREDGVMHWSSEELIKLAILWNTSE